MIIRESKSGLLNPFPFLVWSSVALALAWFWGDELVRVHGWAMNKWFMGLPYLVRLIVRQAHWAFYLGFGLLFVVELCRGRKKTAGAALLYLLANLLVGVLLAKFLKTSLGRPRPFMETHGALSWQPFSSDTHFESLPSGHTTDAWVGLGVIHRLYSPAWVRGTSLAVALLVGVSRVALGKHYPSDVILGLILGYLGGYGLAHLWRRGGFKPVIKICVRAAAGAALIGLAAWAASSAQAPAVQWSRAHGGTGAASPLLLPGQSLGQPLELPAPRLSFLTLRFGTYLAKADGRVELRLLKGREAPLEETELNRRYLARKVFRAERLADNAPFRWDLPPLRLSPGQGLYLVVSRVPRSGGYRPLSVWLDSSRDWPAGSAQILFTQERGLLVPHPAQGHISLELGYDRRPSRLAYWLETPRGLQMSWLIQLGIMVLALGLPWPGRRRRAAVTAPGAE